jgi:hypothetical protein
MRLAEGDDGEEKRVWLAALNSREKNRWGEFGTKGPAGTNQNYAMHVTSLPT